MKYQKIINLLDTKSDNATKCSTKKRTEVHDQSGNAKNNPSTANQPNKQHLKHQ